MVAMGNARIYGNLLAAGRISNHIRTSMDEAEAPRAHIKAGPIHNSAYGSVVRFMRVLLAERLWTNS